MLPKPLLTFFSFLFYFSFRHLSLPPQKKKNNFFALFCLFLLANLKRALFLLSSSQNPEMASLPFKALSCFLLNSLEALSFFQSLPADFFHVSPLDFLIDLSAANPGAQGSRKWWRALHESLVYKLSTRISRLQS